jgi:rod shape-determining protein MreD
MSRPILFAVLLTLTLLQFTVLQRYAPFGATPNIVFLVLFYRFTRCSMQEALIWTFVFGVILDVLAMDPLGAHALAMVPMVLAAQPLRIRPWLINPFSATALVFAAALFYNLFLSLVRGGVSLTDVAIETGMQLLVAPAVYWLYRRIYKR